MPVLKCSWIPGGDMVILGVYCSVPTEAAVCLAFFNGLWFALWPWGKAWAGWVYFFFTSAQGRFQLPCLQNSEGLGLESTLRLFVERESAKCHSDFCPLVLQALPAIGAERLWADPLWVQELVGVQGLCRWAPTFPRPSGDLTGVELERGVRN